MILLRATVEANGNDIARRIATPEEIKASHGKCETCKYFFVDYDGSENPRGYVCTMDDSGIDYPDQDYCNYHEPNESQ